MHIRDDKSSKVSHHRTVRPRHPTDLATPEAELSKLPYTNCRTRILNLKHLPDIPTGKDVSDEQYREIFQRYLDAKRNSSSFHANASDNSVRDEANKNAGLEESQLLRSAIQSLTTGIAPPVAFPTETVYGLGADATNGASIAGIFAAKGRPGDNPLIVHVSSVAHLERCLGGTETDSAIPKVYRELIDQFWPGPLTILVPVPEDGKGVKFAPNVHPGQKTIGFRLPKSPYARFLIAVADRPIAAPSANSSGKPSPTTALHVKEDLDGKINFILDGGECKVGVESTVVDGLHDPPLILRPGGLSKRDIREWGTRQGNIWQHVQNGWEYKTGVKRKREAVTDTVHPATKTSKAAHSHSDGANVYDSPTIQTPNNEHSDLELESDISAAPRAPGMKYKHYAPSGRMFLFEAPSRCSMEARTKAVYDKLGELLNARKPEPNRAHGSPKKLEDEEPTHHLTIGILTSVSWPELAGLQEAWHQLYPAWSDASAPRRLSGHGPAHYSLSKPAEVEGLPAKDVQLYGISLGKDSESIAQNLFAALRTCDALSCEWIFVEAPSSGDVSTEQDNEEFETVLERMRKAASEITKV
ncbi:hypothetical protein LTS08_003946 [Lithohypha guttulata]|nr:hypothetical protein LTS08_003946 [Lithohypha guttulata]